MTDEYDTARWVQENRDTFVIQARIMKLLIERDEARAEVSRLLQMLHYFDLFDPKAVAWVKKKMEDERFAALERKPE
jgi:hypothetical protein